MKNSDPSIVIIVISCVYNILLRRKTCRAISRHPVEKRTENKTIKSDHDHSLPDNYKTIVLGYDFEGNLFPLPSLSLSLILLCPLEAVEVEPRGLYCS